MYVEAAQTTELLFPVVGLIGALIGPAISAVGALLGKRKGNRQEGSNKIEGTETATSSGTTTDTTGFGEQGQELIATLLPMLQRILSSANPVNIGDVERVGDIRTQAANAASDNLFDTLQGNAAAQGLTYSAPAGFARGVAESTRSNLLNNIYADTANNVMGARLARDQVQNQRFGLAQNFLNFLPQVNTRQVDSNTTGTSSQIGSFNNTGRTGSTLGDVLQTGGDLLGLYNDHRKQNRQQQQSPFLNISDGGLRL